MVSAAPPRITRIRTMALGMHAFPDVAGMRQPTSQPENHLLSQGPGRWCFLGLPGACRTKQRQCSTPRRDNPTPSRPCKEACTACASNTTSTSTCSNTEEHPPPTPHIDVVLLHIGVVSFTTHAAPVLQQHMGKQASTCKKHCGKKSTPAHHTLHAHGFCFSSFFSSRKDATTTQHYLWQRSEWKHNNKYAKHKSTNKHNKHIRPR